MVPHSGILPSPWLVLSGAGVFSARTHRPDVGSKDSNLRSDEAIVNAPTALASVLLRILPNAIYREQLN